MVQRLRKQLIDGIRWVKEWAKNNPLGALVVIIFAVWFIVTLVLTEGADRWGFSEQTFWDWMDLLIVPLVLAIGALWFNASQKRTELTVAEKSREVEREIARDRQRQATLEAYYDRMADLLLNHGLRQTTDKDEEQRSIARARTLTVLRGLGGERRGQVFVFLYESGLISKDATVISLRGADLGGIDLRGAILKRADLSGAKLEGAKMLVVDLSDANLKGAKLEGADLTFSIFAGADLSSTNLKGSILRSIANDANLSDANLSDADLRGAILINVNLNRTNLKGANLSNANLEEAKGWTPEQLQQAKSLTNTTMPDGTKYEEWIKKQENQQPQAETDNHDTEKEEKQ